MKIAIIAAMTEELAPFRQHYATEQLWQKGKTSIEKVSEQLYLVASGIGKVNASATTAWLNEKIKPDLIINTGTTGSFSEQLALGSVICSREFIYSDVDATGFDYAFGQVPQMPASYLVDVRYLKLVEKISKEKNLSVAFGTIVTSDSFMSNTQTVANIKKQFPGLLGSDMESCAIAQVAAFYAIPVLNIRGISDHVGQDAPVTFNATVACAASQVFEVVKAVVEAVLEDELLVNLP